MMPMEFYFVVGCDGVLFGRRNKVEGLTYQKVPVMHAPNGEKIKEIKSHLAKLIGMEYGKLPKFILYGELNCNPRKFDYEKRMKQNFVCFGAKFSGNSEGIELSNKLINAGFTTNFDKNEGKVTLLGSKKFFELIESHNISTVPFLTEGTISEVCSKLKEKMLKK